MSAFEQQSKPLFNRKSWVEVKADSHFPIQNLPYGVFKTQRRAPRSGIAIGEFIVDLQYLAEEGYFQKIGFPAHQVFSKPQLNDFMACGREVWDAVRLRVMDLLDVDNGELQSIWSKKSLCLVPQKEATMLLPVKVPNYTDFYSSMQHAYNVGCMFRDPNNALLPNWKHLPVGYHGRASSITLSGSAFHRPKGQMKPPTEEIPIFGPTKQLDFELEMAFVVGKPTQLGDSVSVNDALNHIFGFQIFNDWSARDIQSWEYVPLGPFLGKNFCSTVSPWLVTPEALEPFKVESPKKDTPILPYLEEKGLSTYDINLEVSIQSADGVETLICNSNYKHLYWSPAQQLAHHTVNGCNLEIGDTCASGTISGETPNSFGSMLELAWKGTKPITLANGQERKFIEDGDTVIMRAYGKKEGITIGFGEVRSTVLPVKK